MLILSELSLTVYYNHFKLENGIMTNTKRHQHADQHKNQSSSTGKHDSDKHFIVPKDLDKQFFVLKKCCYKVRFFSAQMLLIGELTPSLNVQSNSTQAKLSA